VKHKSPKIPDRLTIHLQMFPEEIFSDHGPIVAPEKNLRIDGSYLIWHPLEEYQKSLVTI